MRSVNSFTGSSTINFADADLYIVHVFDVSSICTERIRVPGIQQHLFRTKIIAIRRGRRSPVPRGVLANPNPPTPKTYIYLLVIFPYIFLITMPTKSQRSSLHI